MLQMFIVFGLPPSSCEAFSVAYKEETQNTHYTPAIKAAHRGAYHTLFVFLHVFLSQVV